MTVMNIGDFGVAHDDYIDLEFGYFGHTIRVHPDAGELSYLAFMDQANQLDEENEAEGISLMMGYLKEQVHPDDWDLFWKTAKANRQKLPDLMQISKAIVEHSAGFPTKPSSDSSPTPAAVAPKSKAVSSRRAKTRAIERAKPIEDYGSVRDKAYAELAGRPDLQRAVQLANAGADASAN